jgi:hypothetical protein
MHAIDIAFGAASVAFGVFAYASDTIHVRRLAIARRPAPSQFRLSSDGALVLGFADEGALPATAPVGAPGASPMPSGAVAPSPRLAPSPVARRPWFRAFRVGGIHFAQFGRLNLSYSMSRHRPLPVNPFDAYCAAIRARLEARDNARRLASAFLTMGALALLCLALWACAADHRLTRPVQLKPIDARGELWIAGEGDDCASARIGAVYPRDMVFVHCE